jgi:RNA 2',3'-cyclic 3'-phosphodiesterase
MKGENWRVFCAIEIPAAARRAVLQHVEKLKQAVPDARASWARENTLHLTLKFLGSLPISAVNDLSGAATSAVSGLAPFSLRLEQAGVFPKPSQPRVLWIGVNDTEGGLLRLQRTLEKEAARAGFEKEAREFHPHLTIARIRNPSEGRALANLHTATHFQPLDFDVAELLVIRSELSSAGSKYTTVSNHPLLFDKF